MTDLTRRVRRRLPTLGLANIGLVAALGLAGGLAGCDPPAPAATTNPLATVETADGARAGRVLEVLPAGSYTYFRLDDRPQTWAVVMGVGPNVGDRVQAQVFARKADFHSHRLDRTFAALHFVSLTGG